MADRLSSAASGPDAISGISKFLQFRKYRKPAAKNASDRGRDLAQSHHQPVDSAHGSEDFVIGTARSLYRCFLSCKEAFPMAVTIEDFAAAVWNEACLREGARSDLLRRDGEFVCGSMKHLSDIKLKIKQVVEASYEFDTSRAPDSIGRNASRAQALLSNFTFIYRVPNFGGRPHYPYRHPIIQEVINIMWFRNKDDDGIVFREYFVPIPIEVIGLVLTIECCIDEWSDGTWKESNWSEEYHEAIYRSHLNSLHDLRNHDNHRQGRGLLAQIQLDLLKEARKHAGASPDPDADVEDDLPADNHIPGIRVIRHALDTGRDTQLPYQSGTLSGPGPSGTLSHVIMTARSLYRCYLSCKDAFPGAYLKEELGKAVWKEACAREGADPNLYHRDKEFVYSSMRLLNDIKMKIRHSVQSSYEFDTSQVPDIVRCNASRMRALLTKMTFIYREFNFGGRPRYPYRHPIIQKVINITWFQSKDDDGIVFWDYFSPVPIELIGLALTAVECCICEWSTGKWKEANWSEERHIGVYRSHLNSLHDLRNHGRHGQGQDLLAQIQFDLLKEARKHAGAPEDPITGAGRFTISALDYAIEEGLEDLPAYDIASGTPGITVVKPGA